MRSRVRALVTAAATVAATGGIALAAAAPAQATAAECITYLDNTHQNNTTRTAICASTENLAETVSPEYAYTVCVLEMTATGLPPQQANTACDLAAF